MAQPSAMYIVYTYIPPPEVEVVCLAVPFPWAASLSSFAFLCASCTTIMSGKVCYASPARFLHNPFNYTTIAQHIPIKKERFLLPLSYICLIPTCKINTHRLQHGKYTAIRLTHTYLQCPSLCFCGGLFHSCTMLSPSSTPAVFLPLTLLPFPSLLHKNIVIITGARLRGWLSNKKNAS